jgi:hypothetical protein
MQQQQKGPTIPHADLNVVDGEQNTRSDETESARQDQNTTAG